MSSTTNPLSKPLFQRNCEAVVVRVLPGEVMLPVENLPRGVELFARHVRSFQDGKS